MCISETNYTLMKSSSSEIVRLEFNGAMRIQCKPQPIFLTATASLLCYIDKVAYLSSFNSKDLLARKLSPHRIQCYC